MQDMGYLGEWIGKHRSKEEWLILPVLEVREDYAEGTLETELEF